MKLILPFPVSVNHYYIHTKKGVIISTKGRKFKVVVNDAVLEKFGLIKPMTGRIIVTTTLHAPTKMKFDIDNYLKSICDSLEKAGVYENDSQIDVHHVYRGPVFKGGKCEVEIVEVSGDKFDPEYLESLKEK